MGDVFGSDEAGGSHRKGRRGNGVTRVGGVSGCTNDDGNEGGDAIHGTGGVDLSKAYAMKWARAGKSEGVWVRLVSGRNEGTSSIEEGNPTSRRERKFSCDEPPADLKGRTLGDSSLCDSDEPIFPVSFPSVIIGLGSQVDSVP